MSEEKGALVLPPHYVETHVEGQHLLDAIHRHLPDLEKISASAQRDIDGYYRFYHQSFKVYTLQRTTAKIVEQLALVGKDSGVEECQKLNEYFMQIIHAGTGKIFQHEHNLRWAGETRPIVEAWLHAREMLRLVVLSGQRLTTAPNLLPSDWAAVLYLYNIR